MTASIVSPYPQPTDEQLAEMFDDSWEDEVICCAHCLHCFHMTDNDAKMICARLNPYGRWHKREGEVKAAIRHAVKCFGMCDVKGELVDLSALTCDYFMEVDE